MTEKNMRRTSRIWKLPINELSQIVANSNSFTEILKIIGFNSTTGGGYRTLMERINEESIDIKHIKAKKPFQNVTMRSLKEILVENSSYVSSSSLKKRLLNEGLLENKCYNCKLLPIWQKKPLSLQLEHKNGINNDHRIENLELLCPNCHSQTDTYAGKNTIGKRNAKEKPRCQGCSIRISKYSKHSLCTLCYSITTRRATRPSKEELLILISSSPFTKIGEMFDVSDNAVRKWCKSYELPHRSKDIKNLIFT